MYSSKGDSRRGGRFPRGLDALPKGRPKPQAPSAATRAPQTAPEGQPRVTTSERLSLEALRLYAQQRPAGKREFVSLDFIAYIIARSKNTAWRHVRALSQAGYLVTLDPGASAEDPEFRRALRVVLAEHHDDLGPSQRFSPQTRRGETAGLCNFDETTDGRGSNIIGSIRGSEEVNPSTSLTDLAKQTSNEPAPLMFEARPSADCDPSTLPFDPSDERWVDQELGAAAYFVAKVWHEAGEPETMRTGQLLSATDLPRSTLRDALNRLTDRPNGSAFYAQRVGHGVYRLAIPKGVTPEIIDDLIGQRDVARLQQVEAVYDERRQERAYKVRARRAAERQAREKHEADQRPKIEGW